MFIIVFLLYIFKVFLLKFSMLILYDVIIFIGYFYKKLDRIIGNDIEKLRDVCEEECCC